MTGARRWPWFSPRRSWPGIVPAFAGSGPGRCAAANRDDRSFRARYRDLIRKMCRENAGWGAPRIHGELLKLGIEISETSVSKYMVRSRKPPSQTWRTFLENYLTQMVSIDFRVEEIPAGCRLPLAVSTVSGFGRGRDSGCPLPPAQSRAGAFNAHGSYLGCLASKRLVGYGWRVQTSGSSPPSRSRKRSHVQRLR